LYSDNFISALDDFKYSKELLDKPINSTVGFYGISKRNNDEVFAIVSANDPCIKYYRVTPLYEDS